MTTLPIDSHLHVWDPSHLTYDWLENVPSIAGAMTPAQFANTGAQLAGAIFVQADCCPDQALDEAAWVAALDFPGFGGVLGIVAYAPLELGDTAHIAHLQAMPKVVGIRRNAQDEADGFMTSDGYVAGLIAAARAGFSLDMCIRARQLPELRQALERLFDAVPDARVVLDHLGKPDIRTHGGDIHAGDWSSHIEALAAMPGVACKLSGLPTEADWGQWTPEQLLPYLRHALAAFGPRRCLFGSDWPVVELAGGYSRWQAVVSEALAPLPPEARDQVWSGTARRIYRV